MEATTEKLTQFRSQRKPGRSYSVFTRDKIMLCLRQLFSLAGKGKGGGLGGGGGEEGIMADMLLDQYQQKLCTGQNANSVLSKNRMHTKGDKLKKGR